MGIDFKPPNGADPFFERSVMDTAARGFCQLGGDNIVYIKKPGQTPLLRDEHVLPVLAEVVKTQQAIIRELLILRKAIRIHV